MPSAILYGMKKVQSEAFKLSPSFLINAVFNSRIDIGFLKIQFLINIYLLVPIFDDFNDNFSNMQSSNITSPLGSMSILTFLR